MGIDARGNDLGAQSVKLPLYSVEAGQLAAAIGSPVTAIKQEVPILGVETVRQVQCSAIDEIDRHFREGIADTELFRHLDHSDERRQRAGPSHNAGSGLCRKIPSMATLLTATPAPSAIALHRHADVHALAGCQGVV